MGVDTRITLPGFVRVNDVADVVAILAGAEKVRADLGGSHPGAWYVRVPGAEVKVAGSGTLVQCADILLSFPAIDGSDKHYVLYHFEWDGSGDRGLMPRSTPFWLAIGKGLVDFFGGELDYSDSDEIDVDYQVPPRTEFANLNDDAAWQRLQEAKWALKPLTRQDVDAMAPHAAYTLTGEWR